MIEKNTTKTKNKKIEMKVTYCIPAPILEKIGRSGKLIKYDIVKELFKVFSSINSNKSEENISNVPSKIILDKLLDLIDDSLKKLLKNEKTKKSIEEKISELISKNLNYMRGDNFKKSAPPEGLIEIIKKAFGLDTTDIVCREQKIIFREQEEFKKIKNKLLKYSEIFPELKNVPYKWYLFIVSLVLLDTLSKSMYTPVVLTESNKNSEQTSVKKKKNRVRVTKPEHKKAEINNKEIIPPPIDEEQTQLKELEESEITAPSYNYKCEERIRELEEKIRELKIEFEMFRQDVLKVLNLL